MGVCYCSMFCCTLLYVHSSIANILMGKRQLVALLNLSSWCLVMVERLFLAVPRGCLRFVFVVFPDHTHLLFLNEITAFFVTPNYEKRYFSKCQTQKLCDMGLISCFKVNQVFSFSYYHSVSPCQDHGCLSTSLSKTLVQPET